MKKPKLDDWKCFYYNDMHGSEARFEFYGRDITINLETCSGFGLCDRDRDHRAGSISLSAKLFLKLLAKARRGVPVRIGKPGCLLRIDHEQLAIQTELEWGLFDDPRGQIECMQFEVEGEDEGLNTWNLGEVMEGKVALDSVSVIKTLSIPLLDQFDMLFLDAFSVIENKEPNHRTAKDIQLSMIESLVLDIVATRPELMHRFDPRTFEVLVSFQLTKMGFSRVRLTRFGKDDGIDIWAVYAEGDQDHIVVVEVKHQQHNVGIKIVDRINGVRDREGASKAMIVTSSGITANAKRLYAHNADRVALIDYDRLTGLMRGGEGWTRLPSGLWTRPRAARESG